MDGEFAIDNEITMGYIGDWVEGGFVCGYEPKWRIEYSGISKNEISQCSLGYIAKRIKEGFVGGDIIEDNTLGWWKLTLDHN